MILAQGMRREYILARESAARLPYKSNTFINFRCQMVAYGILLWPYLSKNCIEKIVDEDILRRVEMLKEKRGRRNAEN